MNYFQLVNKMLSAYLPFQSYAQYTTKNVNCLFYSFWWKFKCIKSICHKLMPVDCSFARGIAHFAVQHEWKTLSRSRKPKIFLFNSLFWLKLFVFFRHNLDFEIKTFVYDWKKEVRFFNKSEENSHFYSVYFVTFSSYKKKNRQTMNLSLHSLQISITLITNDLPECDFSKLPLCLKSNRGQLNQLMH